MGGDRLKVSKEGNKLTIVVDLAADPQPSKSGKSLIYYTSGGFVYSDKLGVGINLTILKAKERGPPRVKDKIETE